MRPPAEREAVFHPEFREDLRYWVEADRNVALRIFQLLEAVLRDPFRGIGSPEPLKHLIEACYAVAPPAAGYPQEPRMRIPDLNSSQQTRLGV